MKAKFSKEIVYKPNQLQEIISKTCQLVADVVGSTLGPQGKVVLIERQENLPPFATKDGITVFQSLTLEGSIEQVILEALRDSSSKTNMEAGDGTTTATILANALVQEGMKVLKAHPEISYQQIMRILEKYYNIIENKVLDLSLKPKTNNANDLLYKVGLVASNRDESMAKAVLEAFNLVGYNGHVTLLEGSGRGYDVDKIDGFYIGRGFEDSCGRYSDEFINDKSNYRVFLERPRFILYNGKLNNLSTLLPAIEKIGTAFEEAISNKDSSFSPNIVLVAHAFSDEVIAQLGYNFKNPSTLNIYPLKTIMTPQSNSPYHFLVDLSAFTGATIFDPITKPLVELDPYTDLGINSMSSFESTRYKSLLIGIPDEGRVLLRVEELEQQMQQTENSLDKELFQERIGILTGGIAKIKIKGISEAELKEKRHRVEDTILSIKGAVKYGVLPGGGKTFLVLSKQLDEFILDEEDEAAKYAREILKLSLVQPFIKLLLNGGNSTENIEKIKNALIEDNDDFWYTYDAVDRKFGNALELGVIDSAAAVLLSLKNAIGVAKVLMGLSAVIAFKREKSYEKELALKHIESEYALKEAESKMKEENYYVPNN